MDLEFRPVNVCVGGEARIEQVKKGRCLFRLVVDLYIAQFRTKYRVIEKDGRDLKPL